MSRLRLTLGLLAAALVAIGPTAAGASQPDPCDSNPPVTSVPGECDDQPPDPDDPTTTTTTTTASTTTTTTEAPTTTAEPTTTTTRVPPTSLPTTAPPELEPEGPTTTAVVGALTRATQETPDLSGTLFVWVLGLLGTAAVLGAGYVRNRR